MAEHVLRGLAASPGIAAGAALVLDARAPDPSTTVPPPLRAAEAERAEACLAAAASELDALAAGLSGEEAEIVSAGALMARDPALAGAARRLVLEAGSPAAAAVLAAAEEHAGVLAALPDATLAARAEDVRSVGRRAARLAAVPEGAPTAPGDPATHLAGGDPSSRGDPSAPAPPGLRAEGDPSTVVVAQDLGPADVAELAPSAAAFALAAGAVTAHAAIVARSLGIPMVVGLGDGILEAVAGGPVVVDGDAGTATLSPAAARLSDAAVAGEHRRAASARAAADRELPARTRDGRTVRVLANVATAAEVRAGLAAGAEGVGLLRTELAFLDAASWPTEAEHRHALVPVLAAIGPRTATVRVLDYGGDKAPPFLHETPDRGIRLLLRHPEALDAQLRAILASAADTDLRIMLPLVGGPADLAAARAALTRAGAPEVALGAMIETPRAAGVAAAIASRADFLSIGTNDLTAATLGIDRWNGERPATHDPRVLRLIARSVEAAHAAGIPIEVCGEAASDPRLVPLLVGLGVDELSVGASRVGLVRAWIRELSHADVAALAQEALQAGGPEAVERLVEDDGRAAVADLRA